MSQSALTNPTPSSPRGAEAGSALRAPASRVPRFADAAVTRARLSLVGPSRNESPLGPFVILLFVLMVGGVAGLLAFNTSMQQNSFKATSLEKQASALTAKQQSLQIDLADLSDPQALAVRAKALGMVLPVDPAFIRLSDGRVLGDPQPATPDAAMRINPLPAAKPKVLAPAPKVIKVHAHPPRGTDRPVQSVTDDRTKPRKKTDGGQQ